MNVKAIAATLGLASLVLVPGAQADQWNKRTIITVNEAIQVPGKVLQPGKYVMRLLDSPSNRHVVQIFNEREDQLQTTVLAIPNYRLQPTGKTEFQWWETPAGQPRALRAWFYPGDNFGQEFAYPKSEAMAIAATTNQNVPTTFAESQADLATARVGTVDRAGTEMELDRQTYTRADGAQNNDTGNQQIAQATPQAVTERPATERPAATEMAQARTTPQGAMSDADAGRSLPRTASPVPTGALAGLLALGASLALRAANRA
ncbi:MAG TPA: hypothetical protein VER03_06830 [Bryobacteraceae bacterium]|nr:hypothetical protein [Bryobacteraceae bacterium]